MTDSFSQTPSEAIFGSAARRDSDLLSDRDYLIVDDDHPRRRRRRVHLERQGWSVASYTWRRLRSLIEKRALFVQHLKQEALIVRDVDERLRHDLSLFSPKPTYQRDIEEAASMIATASCRVETAVERAWALDVMAVAVRNAAILTLADHGQYLFAFNDVIRALAVVKGLRDQETDALISLRRFKALYRCGRLCSPISSDQFFRLTLVAANTFGGACFSAYGTRSPFEYPDSKSPYLVSRLVEKDLITTDVTNQADREEYAALVSSIGAKVVAPRDYAWQFGTRRAPVWKDLERLKQISVSITDECEHRVAERRASSSFSVVMPTLLVRRSHMRMPDHSKGQKSAHG